MFPEEFRRAGHAAVDWAADFLADPRKYPVLPDVKPGQLTDSLPRSAPDQGETLETIFADFQKLIVPATTHWNHPRFMAYFGCTGSGPGVLAEMLAATLNSNALIWKSAPSVTELEQVTLGWLRQWIGLPEEFFGIIYDTASVSSMHAVAAAREMAVPEARLEGAPRNLTLYTSEQSHSSIEKAAICLGIGHRNVRKIGVDAEFRMRPDELELAIRRDLAEGMKPFCAVATVGTTSTTSVDPVAAIARITEKYGLWLHIDAAYAGSAAILPEFRHILDGAEHAHSLVMNAHKWLFTPVDLSAFYTRRPDILRRAFSLVPEYLMSPYDPRAVNLMEYGVPLGRRFRALKLWFILRFFGREGISEALRAHIRWAQELAGQVDADPRFERAAPTPFSVVSFRFKGTDEQNQTLMDRVNASGEAYLSHTVLHGRFVLRIAIGNLGTTREDVQAVWRLVQRLAEDL
jgi:aromatic-L-amino-acid decarboxylase